MPPFLLPFAAGICSLMMAGLSLIRRRPSLATWCFSIGMAIFGVESLFAGFGMRAITLGEQIYWFNATFLTTALAPLAWLAFSLTYSRANPLGSLRKWAVPLMLIGLLPAGLALAFPDRLLLAAEQGSVGLVQLRFATVARALNGILLIAGVLTLMNLEQTFRAAVGTMRWRIKLVVVAMVVIFGARLYARSQAILFSTPDLSLWSVESGALLIGCGFLALAYLRTGWAEVTVYPSSAVLRSSLTLLIAGGYLLFVGVLAQLVSLFGGAELFQLQALVVLLGLAGLAVLLLSDRARRAIRLFVARHFRKAQHDSVVVWSSLSQRLAQVADVAGLGTASAGLIADTFDVLLVNVWLVDPDTLQFVRRWSTSGATAESESLNASASPAVTAGIFSRDRPFELDSSSDPWAQELRQLNPVSFTNGGPRLCVPLRGRDQALGVIVLADRISGSVYTSEELELLRCIGDQISTVLLKLRLADEVGRAKELEAFRTMSAFFVHDLKNAASSLNLMLRNLPVHFDDPSFRADALRGIGSTAARIDSMIARLTAVRHNPESVRVSADLNRLVSDALDQVEESPNVHLVRELHPVPRILADPEQIQNVVTNLVLNARESLSAAGRIEVRTARMGDQAVLSVTDNGCGMTQAFVTESLFRPFQSTKKKGLGIGLFQSRAIVQAHGGGIRVESEVGKGTTFVASFPVSDKL